MKIYTLMGVSSGFYGTFIVGFPILLMAMDFLGVVVIVVYRNELGNFLAVLHKLCCMFLFSKVEDLIFKSECRRLESCLLIQG